MLYAPNYEGLHFTTGFIENRDTIRGLIIYAVEYDCFKESRKKAFVTLIHQVDMVKAAFMKYRFLRMQIEIMFEVISVF